MRRFRRAVAVAASTLAALAAMAGAAHGYTFTISPGGAFEQTSSALTFSDSGGLINVVCPVTLSGSLSTGEISTEAGSRFGTIDGARVGTCRGGSAVVLTGTASTLSVSGFLGTLPFGVTGLLYNVTTMAIQLNVSIIGIAVTCLYKGVTGKLVSLPNILNSTILGTTMSLVSGSASCPSAGRLNGLLGIRPAQTVSAS